VPGISLWQRDRNTRPVKVTRLFGQRVRVAERAAWGMTTMKEIMNRERDFEVDLNSQVANYLTEKTFLIMEISGRFPMVSLEAIGMFVRCK
jgi:hypothetical protein